MQELLQNRRMVLLLGISALISLVLLASVISRMDFQPSRPIGGNPSGQAIGQPLDVKGLLNVAAEAPFWKQVVFWVALFLIVLLIASLLSPELRKLLIRAFLRFAIFALAFFYLIKKEPEFLAGLFARLPSMSRTLPLQPQTEALPASVFTPPRDVGWLSFGIALGILLLSVILIWQLNRMWTRMRELNSPRRPLEDFARIARDSINDLRLGRSYENAIVECYDRMSDVVARKHGLLRSHEMTPSEFSTRLTQAGLPRDSVQALTALFESVRYGRQPARQAEIDRAISALTAILTYCGESV